MLTYSLDLRGLVKLAKIFLILLVRADSMIVDDDSLAVNDRAVIANLCVLLNRDICVRGDGIRFESEHVPCRRHTTSSLLDISL